MDVVMDKLEPQDWELLREMRLASLADSPDAFWATLADESGYDRYQWEAFVRAAAWFVASTGSGDRVGIAGALTRAEAPDEPELIGMWVAPAARGHGVGAALVDAVCAWATEQAAPVIGLWVIDGNDPARGVYLRAGFIETGERAPLPRDLNQVELRMRKELAR
jgi:GNAT superfamily N-acetyltransferase